MIVYARILLETVQAGIRSDLQQALLHWEDHFNKRHYEGSWTGLPLRIAEGREGMIPGLTADEVYTDHVNMDLFPSVKKLLEKLHCTVMSVRLLNLSAGAVIKPHRDHELSFEQGEARLHVPVETNPDVEFYVNDQRVPMRAGECWYINANLKHQVANRGTTDRIHLVIDCKVNDWLQQQMTDAPVISRIPDYSREQLSDMIGALRAHHTLTAGQLADEFQKQYDLYQTDL